MRGQPEGGVLKECPIRPRINCLDAAAWLPGRGAARLSETEGLIRGGEPMRSKIAGAFVIALLSQWAPPALAADPLKIGVMMPTSGVFAVLGQRQLNGMRFAIEEAGGEVAGRKLEMLHGDR